MFAVVFGQFPLESSCSVDEDGRIGANSNAWLKQLQQDFDVVSWQSKLVDAAHLLWLGIAWADEIEGRRPVGLTLRHVDGRTIRSDTLWTYVHPRSGRGESMRRRMEQARNLAQRWRSQAVIRTE